MSKLHTFDSFLNEDRELNSVLANDLFELGKGFTSDDEIAQCIEKLGLKQINPKGIRTADWTFEDPDTLYKYVSYTTGDVRSVSPIHKTFRGHETKNVTRISRSSLATPRERLLLILRRTMKAKGIYAFWKRGTRTAKELIDSPMSKAFMNARLRARILGL